MRSTAIQASIAGLVAVVMTAVTVPGPAVAAALLAPHRAVYDLSLKSRDSGTSIMSVRGRMVHEFTGTACEGYTVTMRWIAEMGDAQGDVDVDDIRFASFEGSGGETYSFTSVRRMNDAVIEEVKANAERASGTNGHVQLSQPSQDEFELPAGTVFPTEHLAAILKAAMAGERIAEMRVYDVSGDGKTIYQTLAVIGPGRRDRPIGALGAGAAGGKLDGLHAWRVTVSYFEGDGGADETPAFAQSFSLYENGVASDLVLDYGDLVISGELTDLELLAAGECAAGALPR